MDGERGTRSLGQQNSHSDTESDETRGATGVVIRRSAVPRTTRSIASKEDSRPDGLRLPKNRIRDIVTKEEADLESSRQTLFDQEWTRRKDKLKTCIWIVCLATSPISVDQLSKVLLSALGP